MSFYEDLFAGLTAHAGLSALIADRLYPLRWPQSPAFPLVTYQPIGGPWEEAITRSQVAVGERLQFDCWADTFDDAVAVRSELRAALVALPEGSVPLYEVGGVTDLPALPEPDTGLERAILEARIVHG